MKTHIILKSVIALSLAAGTTAWAQSDADVTVKGDKVKIRSAEGNVTIKGPGAEQLAEKLLAPEVEASMVEGYIIPQEYRTYFQAVPNPEPGLIVRYYNGRAYYVNQDTYQIVRVVPLAVRVR